MQGTAIRSALVSTNSVSQGESVANLWKPLFEAGVHIDFAHRTFRWDSEAKIKAHVHCVIIGFSTAPNSAEKVLYSGDRIQIVKNINGYLLVLNTCLWRAEISRCAMCPKSGLETCRSTEETICSQLKKKMSS